MKEGLAWGCPGRFVSRGRGRYVEGDFRADRGDSDGVAVCRIHRHRVLLSGNVLM